MSADHRAQGAPKRTTPERPGSKSSKKRRTHIIKEACSVFQSTEKIWRAMDAGHTSRSLGLQQLVGNRDKLIRLSRQDCEIYFELLKLQEPA